MQNFHEKGGTVMEFKIVAYDENFLYLSDGSKISPPDGCKFDVDVIKKIIEAGEEQNV